MEENRDQTITQGEAFEEFYEATVRLRALGGKVVKVSQALESGKKINPRSLKKLGGSIKWWEHQSFLWANVCMTLYMAGERHMSERLRDEGRLAETRLKIKETELRLTYLRDGLQRELDQFEPLENLKGEIIKLMASDFAAQHGDYLGLLNLEKGICNALGK
jgi:hypothetical protein